MCIADGLQCNSGSELKGQVASSAAEPRVCAPRRPVPRLSVFTHARTQNRKKKKKKINMSPGDRVEEDGKIATRNQRDETKIWPLVYLILSFLGLTFQRHAETAEPTTTKQLFSS